MNPVEAIRLATLNPAEYVGLRNRGAIAPGRRADLVVLDNLTALEISEVWTAGRKVATHGSPTDWTLPAPSAAPSPSMRIPWEEIDLKSTTPNRQTRSREGGGTPRVPVIEVVPNQILAQSDTVEPTVREGMVVADSERDLLKIAVIERHSGSGRVGQGLVNSVAWASAGARSPAQWPTTITISL